MPRKSTVESIFCTRQIIEKKYGNKQRKLSMVFIDLEKERIEWGINEKMITKSVFECN